MIRHVVVGALASVVFCVCAGCELLPASGPESWNVTAGPSESTALPYALVPITSDVVNVLASNTPRIAGAFTDRRGPKEIRFGVGDIVGVTLFESGVGGLFFPTDGGVRPGNYLALPSQPVDTNGNISVPYAGAIRAAGRSPTEVQRAIVDALKGRALGPQAVVVPVEQRATSIALLGDVRSPGRFPVTTNGERLLEAIASAGGLSSPGYESWVVVEREGRKAIAPFGALVDEPENDIFVRPRDIVYVFREPQTFLAFGASGRQGQISFDAWRVSLSEAVGKASGLNDGLADPASVFLYRGETRHVAELLGVDVSKFGGPIIPIIYQLNLRDPSGYFLSSKFEMRNKDVIFVSNASSVESSKLMNYIRLIVATANDPITAANGAYALRAAVTGGPATTTIVTTTTSTTAP